MANGFIKTGEHLIREYEEVAYRVRLIALFDGDKPVGYRVEVRFGTETHAEFKNEVFGVGLNQFGLAVDTFKARVRAVVS